MRMGSLFVVVIVGIAVLVAVGVLLALLLRSRKNDWGGPPPPTFQSGDRGPYGATATDYPSAPLPASAPSMSEGIEGPSDHVEPSAPAAPPQPDEGPRQIDDTQRFRDQHRPDDPPPPPT